mmetsp:Transcript_40562/g.114884  ORF Transcript_40562/g.114884 Transcript_40562/m.114884 type:complete len:583 (+) Transcript_40562:229-1977(+)|eukprot:CAMPEP_0117668112 /NCGR_PEP_ID=MMETSP0804-20121206/11350_1 /TAXON_ID=1074897 /ORGANISM="Tetraselmis astigmatica, Strain CCMP880" /LENGTH=582 /DNA_ID=CAMNT_0005475931 /DNA_START=110 /DNA_END=1858 /DNA_ORIENTATION=-
MASGKKLINSPGDVVEEMVEGLLLSHPNLIRLERHHVLLRRDYAAVRARQQVALVTGGGSGHEPAHAGFVGEGMLTAAVCGGVFASPSAQAVLDTIRTVCGPAGCLLIVKNYTGDRLNFGVAAEEAKAQGLRVEMVIVGDDVAVNAGDESDNVVTGRRGLTGTLFVHKVAGASAAAGCSLSEVATEARAAAEAVGSMGVALSTCTVPGGACSDRIAAGECEVGLGIHGEPGRSKQPLGTADDITAQLVKRILEVQQLQLKAGESNCMPKAALMINNLGGSSVLEMHIVARAAFKYLSDAGIDVTRVFTGTLMTSLEMAGVIITVVALDNLRAARIDAPTLAPAWPAAAALEPVGHLQSATVAAVVPPPEQEAHTSVLVLSEAEAKVLSTVVSEVCTALVAAEARLSELDRLVGDGDCGATFRRAAEGILAAGSAGKLAVAEPDRLCSDVAAVVRDVMGGSSGAVMDIMFHAAATKLREKPGDWRGALSHAVMSASFYGGAKPCCRTMLDALVPAAEAAGAGKPLAEIAAAAEAGADATATMKPLAGRSSYLSTDITDGTPDPGAVAMAIVLCQIANTMQEAA